MIRNRYAPEWDSGNEGVAIIFVVGYLAVVTLLAATFLAALNRNVTRATVSQGHQICMNIAEGGVEQAIAALRGGVAVDQTGSLGDGQFTATVREAGGVFEIVSTASLSESPHVRARVSARVTREAAGGIRVLRWSEVTKW